MRITIHYPFRFFFLVNTVKRVEYGNYKNLVRNSQELSAKYSSEKKCKNRTAAGGWRGKLHLFV